MALWLSLVGDGVSEAFLAVLLEHPVDFGVIYDQLQGRGSEAGWATMGV
jgi:hypothetical protein